MKPKFNHFKLVILGAVTVLAASAGQVFANDPFTMVPNAFVPSIASPYPIGGAPVAASVDPFTSATLSGVLTSTVIAGDTSNPFGGLTFTYQFSLGSNSLASASELSVGSYGSALTDVSYDAAPSGPPGALPGGAAPDFFSRSSEGGGSGQVVRFEFFSTSSVLPGQFSALLVVQTDAQSFQPSIAAIIDDSSANVTSFAPLSAVPEPGVCALFLVGAGVFGAAFRRKR